jgi:hypothetical protein
LAGTGGQRAPQRSKSSLAFGVVYQQVPPAPLRTALHTVIDHAENLSTTV